MAYDHELAHRLRQVLQSEPELTERAMFGGLGFMIGDHLAVSANSKGALLVRVDPAGADSLVSEPQVRRCVMGGRVMNGWLEVDADAIGTDEELRRWVGHGLAYTRSLPPKRSRAVSPARGSGQVRRGRTGQ